MTYESLADIQEREDRLRKMENKKNNSYRWLSQLDLVNLTAGLLGAQLAWTIEMAFGTPFLLSLGLSKTSTSLVWLAGPLSGLIVQPVIGSISDASNSRFRRRKYILISAGLTLIFMLILAFVKSLSVFLVSLFNPGLGDWDPKESHQVAALARFIGVVGFYCLDFALNGLQATLRALILDVCPSEQQNAGNAWHGRMTHIAHICGYLAGFIDLSQYSSLYFIGGGQFRKLVVLSAVILVITVSVTCYTQEEFVPSPASEGTPTPPVVTPSSTTPPRKHYSYHPTASQRNLATYYTQQDDPAPTEVEDEKRSIIAHLQLTLGDIVHNIRNLPTSVRRLCYVQLFAWTAFFPFLFYSTTYISEVIYLHEGVKTSPDEATRRGSLALLFYAIIALSFGFLLPMLTEVGTSWIFNRCVSKNTRMGLLVRRFATLVNPRNMWTFGLGWYALMMLSTFFVGKSVERAMVTVALVGISWAINCWVPFALVMEAIHEEASPAPTPFSPENESYIGHPRRGSLLYPASGANASAVQRNLGFLSNTDYSTDEIVYNGRADSSFNNISITSRPQPFRVEIREFEGSESLNDVDDVVRARQVNSAHEARASTVATSSDAVFDGRTDAKAQSSRTAQLSAGERTPLLSSHISRASASQNANGATILGIHNLSIVLPQFFVAIVAACIFKILSLHHAPGALTNDTAWVLRFGGLASAIGCGVSRCLLKPGSEKIYEEEVLS